MTFQDELFDKVVYEFIQSDYDIKSIDARLLVLDYCYIYHYLTGPMVNIAYTKMLLSEAITKSTLPSFRSKTGWIIYSNEIESISHEYSVFTGNSLSGIQCEALITLHSYAKHNHDIEFAFAYTVFDLSSQRKEIIREMDTQVCLSLEDADNMIFERISIIEDFIDSKTVPDKCIDKLCLTCEFRPTCDKAD